MRIGWIGIVGILALSGGGAMAWSHRDMARKQRGPAYRPIDYEVVRAEVHDAAHLNQAASGSEGWIFIRFRDPFTGEVVEHRGVTTPEAVPTYVVGQHRKGLYAPQWPHPELTETPPDRLRELRFTARGSMILVSLGLAILAFAFKTGRFFAD